MSTRRGGLPYIWCSWLTAFMAGERHCWYAPWFQARHTNIASPEARSVDLSQWTAEHGAMVQARADQLRAEGWDVYLEDQNAFKLKGKTAILSGKIDIVAVKPKEARALVIDCKTGREKDADIQQVIIYLYAVPRFHHAVRACHAVLTGEVQYKHTSKVVTPAPTAYPILYDAIARVAQGEPGRWGQPPIKRPSLRECQHCKLSSADCPERETEDTQPSTGVEEF